VAFSPGGTTLAAVGNDGAVQVWNTTEGAALISFSGHTRDVFSVQYSPDGATLATAAEDGTVRLWDVTTGTEVRRFTLAASERAYSIAFSPDGLLIAAGVSQGFGDEVGMLAVWDAVTGDLLTTVRAHNGRIRALAFSQDGRAIISGSFDGSVAVWRVK
jgi:WD40 repeat protein